MSFRAILAMSDNRVIGNKNSLPWKIKEDLSFFKKMTWGGNLIMGRKTYESLGRDFLPNRKIFVLTRKNNFGWTKKEEGESSVEIFTDTLKLPNLDYWIVGGVEIFNLFMSRIQEIYVSHIYGDFEGDVFIKPFEWNFTKREYVLTHNKFRIVKYFN